MTDWVHAPESFTPHLYACGGRVLVDNGGHLGKYLSAEMTADTRCRDCGELFQGGDSVHAQLAENPRDAVWTHDTCPGSVSQTERTIGR